MFARLYITNIIELENGLLIPSIIAKNLFGAKYIYLKICCLLAKIEKEYSGICVILKLCAKNNKYCLFNNYWIPNGAKVILERQFS
jgi:hypothetical protein